MRPFTTLALGLLGAAVASASDVESLTKDTFPDFVKDNDLVLAECKSPQLRRNLVLDRKLIFYSLRSTFILIQPPPFFNIANTWFFHYSHGGKFAQDTCSFADY
jgi:hypothetical protein